MTLPQDLVKEIKLALKEPNSAQNGIEALDLDANRVRDKIRSVFTSKVHQLRVREQWLLNQVEQLHHCMLLVLQSNEENVTEGRGKLKACLDILQCCEASDTIQIKRYVDDILETYRDCVTQITGNATIDFECKDSKLSEVIRKFGSVKKVVDDTASDASWEFPASETQSTDYDCNETLPETDDIEIKETSCCGNCDTKNSFEIEDLDKYFSSKTASVDLKEVCRANETCCSFEECLCDQKCYLIASENGKPSTFDNKYVNAIESSFLVRSAACTPVKSSTNEYVKTTEFTPSTQHITTIEEEFMQIMSGVYSPIQIPSKPVRSSTSPWSMEQVSFEINQILEERNQLTTTQTQVLPIEIASAEINDIISSPNSGDSFNFFTPSSAIIAQNPTPSAPNYHFGELNSQLDSILNGEMPMFGVDTEEFTGNSQAVPNTESYHEKFSFILKQKEQNQQDRFESEKDDHVEKYIKDDNPKKWSTVEDVQDILSAILN